VSDDRGLFSVATGTGPPVVLVHGALGDYRQWSLIGAGLSPHFQAIAISRRYHWPDHLVADDAICTYESNRDDLVDFIRTLGQRVHLVGHSYGAGVSLLSALADQDRIRTLTLIEPAFASVLSRSAAGYEGEAHTRDAVMASVRSLLQAGEEARAVEIFFDWVQGETGGFGRLSDDTRRGLLENGRTLGPTFAVAARNVTIDHLKTLRVPTLVLTGERTRPWYGLIADAVVSGIPGAERGVIPASAHMTIVENPPAAARLIRDFLLRHSPDARS
jgi:pimeloyl-ACP methyl ester carboxylesterase